LEQKSSSRLNQRLLAYSATSKSIASPANLRERMGSWPTYCAATAAALAGATSASAGIIVVNPSLPPLTIGTHSVGFASQLVPVQGLSSAAFKLQLQHRHTTLDGVSTLTGQANFNAGHTFLGFRRALIATSYHSSARKLASGDQFFPGSFFRFGGFAGLVKSTYTVQTGPNTSSFAIGSRLATRGQWQGYNVTGFAGALFLAGSYQIHGTHSGHPTTTTVPLYDVGWLKIRIQDLNSDGIPDSIQLLQYAYNDAPFWGIRAGQTQTPEPATASMLLLAAGAAGVSAWKRRRKAA
jgi:hypothetical protein